VSVGTSAGDVVPNGVVAVVETHLQLARTPPVVNEQAHGGALKGSHLVAQVGSEPIAVNELHASLTGVAVALGQRVKRPANPSFGGVQIDGTQRLVAVGVDVGDVMFQARRAAALGPERVVRGVLAGEGVGHGVGIFSTLGQLAVAHANHLHLTPKITNDNSRSAPKARESPQSQEIPTGTPIHRVTTVHGVTTETDSWMSSLTPVPPFQEDRH